MGTSAAPSAAPGAATRTEEGGQWILHDLGNAGAHGRPMLFDGPAAVMAREAGYANLWEALDVAPRGVAEHASQMGEASGHDR